MVDWEALCGKSAAAMHINKWRGRRFLAGQRHSAEKCGVRDPQLEAISLKYPMEALDWPALRAYKARDLNALSL